jgi:phosphoenolpyruvate-protein kinase (PTS system EI component)
VTICGEMAARPDLALALVALGADAISVPPPVIPELKQAFASAQLAPLVAAIDGILASPDAPMLHEALRALVPA